MTRWESWKWSERLSLKADQASTPLCVGDHVRQLNCMKCRTRSRADRKRCHLNAGNPWLKPRQDGVTAAKRAPGTGLEWGRSWWRGVVYEAGENSFVTTCAHQKKLQRLEAKIYKIKRANRSAVTAGGLTVFPQQLTYRVCRTIIITCVSHRRREQTFDSFPRVGISPSPATEARTHIRSHRNTQTEM